MNNDLDRLKKWPKKVLEWTENNKAYLSIPFTWLLTEAFSRCVYFQNLGYEVHAGGPAVSLMPEVLKGVAITGESMPCLSRHNANATKTSTGCVNNCSFCAVPKIEGDLKEFSTWQPNPIVCDNNVFACSIQHFDKVIDSLISVPGVDFNQGLDCRLMTAHHIERLRDLDILYIRFSWDYLAEEPFVMDAIKRVHASGFPKDKIRVYVLYNHQDTPEDAVYRLSTLRKMGIVANPMRYQAIQGSCALVKNSYVDPNWNYRELKRFTRYWNRSNYLGGIPYAEYRG
jgi:hypothetical protein